MTCEELSRTCRCLSIWLKGLLYFLHVDSLQLTEKQLCKYLNSKIENIVVLRGKMTRNTKSFSQTTWTKLLCNNTHYNHEYSWSTEVPLLFESFCLMLSSRIVSFFSALSNNDWMNSVGLISITTSKQTHGEKEWLKERKRGEGQWRPRKVWPKCLGQVTNGLLVGSNPHPTSGKTNWAPKYTLCTHARAQLHT